MRNGENCPSGDFSLAFVSFFILKWKTGIYNYLQSNKINKT